MKLNGNSSQQAEEGCTATAAEPRQQLPVPHTAICDVTAVTIMAAFEQQAQSPSSHILSRELLHTRAAHFSLQREEGPFDAPAAAAAAVNCQHHFSSGGSSQQIVLAGTPAQIYPDTSAEQPSGAAAAAGPLAAIACIKQAPAAAGRAGCI
jgi:hypothetical protein